MPVLSDFTVVNSNVRFQQNNALSLQFNTGGRHNSVALLDPAVLGGFRSGDATMNVRFRLNGSHLTTIGVRRWENHSLIEYARPNIVIPTGRLRSTGNNVLVIDPTYESSSDYLFIGTVVVHFHQVG